jgi:hypothetical protein
MAIVIPDSALGDRAYGINAGKQYLLNKLRLKILLRKFSASIEDASGDISS